MQICKARTWRLSTWRNERTHSNARLQFSAKLKVAFRVAVWPDLEMFHYMYFSICRQIICIMIHTGRDLQFWNRQTSKVTAQLASNNRSARVCTRASWFLNKFSQLYVAALFLFSRKWAGLQAERHVSIKSCINGTLDLPQCPLA